MTQKHPLIRTIYLYLFTLIGLVLVTIGAIRFLDMGLKAFVFTKADDPEKIQRNYYYGLPIPVEKVSVLETSEDLTTEEIASVKSWIANYQEWQEDEAKIDYLVSRRQREASINLAMIIIGLPLYLYHWRIIRRETKMLRMLKAVSIFVGTIIGAGIFGIPYVVGKSGILPGLFYFVVLGGVVLLIHLFFGEAFLRTKELCRLPGLAKKYLGNWGNVLITISVSAGLIGALLAYLILTGNFLKILLQPFSDLPVSYLALIFWVFMSYLIFRGIKVIASIELLTSIIFFLMTVIILAICLPAVDFHNISLLNTSDAFLPFGVILFSLIGWSAIPEAIEFLKAKRAVNHIRKTIILSTVLVVPFYIIFTIAVLGVAGVSISQDTLSSLSPFLGPKIIVLGIIAALVTLADSILVIGVHLKNTFIYDLKLSNNLATLLACGAPLVLFLLGLRNFIGVLGVVGTLIGVIEGILIILIFKKAKTMGNRQPEYSLRVPSVLLYFLMIVLVLGAVSQFIA